VQLARVLYGAGDRSEAERLCRQALALDEKHFEALTLLGFIAARTGRPVEAVELLGRAIAARPQDAVTHYNRANILRKLGRLDDALEGYDRALKLAPALVEAHNNRGLTLRQMGCLAESLASYDRAVGLKPDYSEAQNNRGNVLREMRRLEEALAAYARALESRAGFVEAHANRGVVLHELRRLEAALASFDRAIGLNPQYAEAHNGRGNVLSDLRRFDAALASYDRAAAIKPDKADAYVNRGNVLRDLKRYREALASYDQALAREPEHPWLYGSWLHTRMRLCDWRDLEATSATLAARIERGETVTAPFFLLGLSDSPSLQRRAAQVWVAKTCPPSEALPPLIKHPRHARIRVAYFSADFYRHATANLVAGLFENHDRARFHVMAFCLGASAHDEMRARLLAAFDRFLDVHDKSDREIAELSRALEVDIAVDLKGFTQGARTGIFACRAAPVQVSYLGYPATMGAPYIDYLIADSTLVPPESREHYTERVVSLPGSYQVNDRMRPIGEGAPERARYGLPAGAFVFCCFNGAYKITPPVFDGWMRILRRVENSILWLLEDNGAACDNLRVAAEARGVSASRLIFARRAPPSEHLGRQRLADLFLDTSPCNAHTTASDALWAGLPVITRVGESFAGRVAASLLGAVGLPELVTSTPDEYERCAVELAADPHRLLELRERLRRNRLTAPLFDTAAFARRLESAYLRMYERSQAELQPEPFDVAG